MQRLLYLICIIIAPSCIAQAKHIHPAHSDLQEWGLRGKVKTITLSVKYIVSDTLFATIQTIASYDENGNTVSVEKATKKPATAILLDKSLTVYAYIGKERFGVELENEDTISTIHKKWLTENTYVEQLHERKEKRLSVFTTVLNEDNRIDFLKITLYKNEDTLQLDTSFVLHYLFDKANRMIATVSADTTDKETTETNEDLAFDKQGNATQSVKSTIGKKQKRIVSRQYEYYD